MVQINQNKVEKFYDIMDSTANLLHDFTKKNYIESLIMTSNNILEGDINNDHLTNEAIEELNTIYKQLEGETFNKEEIRKAFQLCLLKGFKHVNSNLNNITPDSIGILFSFLIDKFYQSHKVNVLDATVGTGNLLISMLNHSNIEFDKIYGVDHNYNFLEIALSLADLTNYDIEFVHQDSTYDLVVPKFNLIISDLPNENDRSLAYKIVSNLMKYNEPDGYFIYLIPNDFFERENNQEIKDVILNSTYMEALISLPTTMFQTKEMEKSILVLRKRGENTMPTKEVLVLNIPSFQNPQAVKSAMDKINTWFDKR